MHAAIDPRQVCIGGKQFGIFHEHSNRNTSYNAIPKYKVHSFWWLQEKLSFAVDGLRNWAGAQYVYTPQEQP